MSDPRIHPCCVVLEPITPKQVGFSVELRNAIVERNMLTTRTRKKILLDLDEITDANIEKDFRSIRNKAVKEILTSEISYLNQLELIKDYFMKPIKERAILSLDEFQILFGNIPTIYNVNCELLHELRKEPDNVAQAFSRIAPFLKLYSVYAYDYKKSLNILQEAPINNKEFSKFLELQESRPEVQKKLSALLIAPIQRIPRYRLLLEQVLQHTATSHPTYPLIVASLKKVEQAASHINSLVQDQENTQRLLELQRSLQNCYPSIIKPDRKLIKEGVLMKMSQNGNQSYKRYIVLMSDILMSCKLKKDNPNSANSLKCSCILPLNKCVITEMLNKGAFKISCQTEVLILHHHRAQEAELWVKTLKETIKKYVNNRRTLRKDSSSRRPAHRKLISEYQDVGISPGKPRRKRQKDDKNFDDVFKNISNDSEDSDNGTTSCFPARASKRKFIRDDDEELPVAPKLPQYVNVKSGDSLFPLREHVLTQARNSKAVNNDKGSNKYKEEEIQQPVIVPAIQNNNVFVFGGNNQPKGFRFMMGNVLTGLGNSLKRIFGFREN